MAHDFDYYVLALKIEYLYLHYSRLEYSTEIKKKATKAYV